MPNQYVFLLLVLSTLALSPRPAAAVIDNPHLGEVTVKVSGVTRSKPGLVEALVGQCLQRGDYRSWSEVDGTALQQCLRNSRLFSRVAV